MKSSCFWFTTASHTNTWMRNTNFPWSAVSINWTTPKQKCIYWTAISEFFIWLSFSGFREASLSTRMIDVRAWAEYVVEWAAKDPYGFLTTVILALTPLFIASALLSWKLAKMIEVRDREQKKKQKRQENIAKAKRTKKDWPTEGRMKARGQEKGGRTATITLKALLIPNKDIVPLFVPALCQHRPTTPHVRGRRRDAGPTGLTVLRWTVLPGGGSSQWDFCQQEHIGHLYVFMQRFTGILWCSCCNTLHSIISIPVLRNWSYEEHTGTFFQVTSKISKLLS